MTGTRRGGLLIAALCHMRKESFLVEVTIYSSRSRKHRTIVSPRGPTLSNVGKLSIHSCWRLQKYGETGE